MDFKSAGKTYGGGLAVAKTSDVYYPSIEIDLKKFPELSKDVGDSCEIVVRGVMTSKRIDETSKCQTFEVREMAKAEPEESRNEADQMLSKLKSSKRY